MIITSDYGSFPHSLPSIRNATKIHEDTKTHKINTKDPIDGLHHALHLKAEMPWNTRHIKSALHLEARRRENRSGKIWDLNGKKTAPNRELLRSRKLKSQNKH